MNILKSSWILLSAVVYIVIGIPEEDIDLFINAILNCTDIPGISLAVVENNQVIRQKIS